MFLLKIILSSLIPFIKEWFFSKDSPYMEGKERKTNNFLVTVIGIILVVGSTITLDYLDTKDLLTKTKTSLKTAEEKLTLKERQILAMDAKLGEYKTSYETLKDEKKWDDIAYESLKEKYDDLKKLKEPLVSCPNPEVQVSELDVDTIKDKLDQLRRNRQ